MTGSKHLAGLDPWVQPGERVACPEGMSAVRVFGLVAKGRLAEAGAVSGRVGCGL